VSAPFDAKYALMNTSWVKLVFCVVVNVLRHVFIKNGKRSRINWVSAATWNFVVLDSPQFVVLLP
jgi:hypothetical protein